MLHTASASQPSRRRRSGAARRSQALLCGVAICLLGAGSLGCHDLSYRAAPLGAGPNDYDRIFPLEHLRLTDIGRCYLSPERNGRIDALVLQLGEDRRVVGRWQATFIDRTGRWNAESGFRLRGEVFPERLGMGGARPFDTLKSVVLDLVDSANDPLSLAAHARIAAGLERVAQHFNAGPLLAPADEDVQAFLDEIDPRGAATLIRDGDVLRVTYAVGAQR